MRNGALRQAGWLKSQWFLVDKLVAGGLDNYEFCSVYGEAYDATGVLLGKDAKKVPDFLNSPASITYTEYWLGYGD